MKYRIKAVVKGSVLRPYYEGFCNVYSNEANPDFQLLVFRELKSKSFPEISITDVRVIKVEIEP